MGGEGDNKLRAVPGGGRNSPFGCGATAHSDIPSVSPEAPSDATTSVRLRASRPKLSVLVVDDEPRVLESLRLVLEGVHDVRTESHADKALELLREDPRRFDAVLCDLTMAGVDGIAFYEEMVRLDVADRFVVMTGGAYTARGCAFLEKRACPIIDKPFLFEELLSLLDDVGRTVRDVSP